MRISVWIYSAPACIRGSKSVYSLLISFLPFGGSGGDRWEHSLPMMAAFPEECCWWTWLSVSNSPEITSQILFMLTIGLYSLGPTSNSLTPGRQICSNILPGLRVDVVLCSGYLQVTLERSFWGIHIASSNRMIRESRVGCILDTWPAQSRRM